VKEIAEMKIKKRKEVKHIKTDECFNKVDLKRLKRLPAVFKKDGKITAGNASPISDGAASLILASGAKVKELNLKPFAKILSFADASLEPTKFTIAPHLAIQEALKKAQISKDQVDCFEINEAFAVVPLANAKLLNISLKKVNLYGGAVALGENIKCSNLYIY
jgi:acetyl-CoA C-acetyltransferase